MKGEKASIVNISCGVGWDIQRFEDCLGRLNSKRFRFAFTLAEVLITLGIIGIVAAMTIPTLVQNYQTRAWDTSATVFERKLEEALKVMNSQQVLAGYQTTEDFVQEFSKHISIIKVCENVTDCFEDKVSVQGKEVDLTKLKTSKNFGWKDWDETNAVGVQFSDGVAGIIAYNTKCKQDAFSNQVNVNNCIAILYDTSPYSNPNELGKDLNMLNVRRLLDVGCIRSTGSTCITHVVKGNKPVTKAECEQMIKDGYGIKECSYDNDYWAGGVKACGGVQYLPSTQQLREIGADIYQGGDTYASFNLDIAKIYGYINGNQVLFSNKEDTSTGASGMIIYGPNPMWGRYTYRINHWGAPYQRNSGYTIICVD